MIHVIDLASDGREAIQFVNEILDDAVTVVSDRFDIPRSDLELALASQRAAWKQRLRDAMRDRVHVKYLPEDV
jgi:hypothetical protein